MILNYIKLSLRLLSRNPFITAINLLGLSIGFAAFFILWPYAYSELTTGQIHKDYERIARLTWHYRFTDNNRDWQEFFNSMNFTGVGKHVADEFTEVEALTRYVSQREFVWPEHGTGNKVLVTVYERDSSKRSFRQENVAFVDPNFFQCPATNRSTFESQQHQIVWHCGSRKRHSLFKRFNSIEGNRGI
jgi:putative ABC transport system permease protein